VQERGSRASCLVREIKLNQGILSPKERKEFRGKYIKYRGREEVCFYTGLMGPKLTHPFCHLSRILNELFCMNYYFPEGRERPHTL
jgi:hypothetical protein